jgi:hypothetical protein
MSKAFLPNGAVATGDEKVDAQLARLPHSAFRRNNHKFGPKLERAERMAIKAYHLRSVPQPLLAAAFGVDRRTIGHICNDSSINYRDVAKEVKALGETAFCNRYMEDKYTELIAKVAASPPPEVAQPTLEAARSVRLTVGPNPRATKNAGLNVVKTEATKHSHRVLIEFRTDQPHGECWYYRDLDNPTHPDTWFRAENDEDTWTSTKTLAYVEANLFDL